MFIIHHHDTRKFTLKCDMINLSMFMTYNVDLEFLIKLTKGLVYKMQKIKIPVGEPTGTFIKQLNLAVIQYHWARVDFLPAATPRVFTIAQPSMQLTTQPSFICFGSSAGMISMSWRIGITPTNSGSAQQ
jgi:hypothetical protein